MNKLLSYSLIPLLSLLAFCGHAHKITPFAELLYWQASEDPESSWASVINAQEFNPQNTSFNWSPGFRGGLSFEPHSYFETSLYWTYYSTKTTDNIPFGPYLITPEFFSGFLSENVFFGADSDWKLTMNMVDLAISHEFKVTQDFSLTPALGLKGGTLNQNIDVLWEADIYNATEKVSHDFWGIGPTFGLTGTWNISKEFRFVGNFSAAFLWGQWNVTDVYTRPYVPFSLTPEATEITTELDDSALGTVMLTYFVGLEWVPSSFSQVTFQLGYEMEFWPNQLRLPTFQELPTHGDLTLQGGTCGVSIDFY